MMVTYDSFFFIFMLVTTIHYMAVLSMKMAIESLFILYKKAIIIICSDLHRLVILPQLHLLLNSLLKKEPPVLGIITPSQFITNKMADISTLSQFTCNLME